MDGTGHARNEKVIVCNGANVKFSGQLTFDVQHNWLAKEVLECK